MQVAYGAVKGSWGWEEEVVGRRDGKEEENRGRRRVEAGGVPWLGAGWARWA